MGRLLDVPSPRKSFDGFVEAGKVLQILQKMAMSDDEFVPIIQIEQHERIAIAPPMKLSTKNKIHQLFDAGTCMAPRHHEHEQLLRMEEMPTW
mmetsp:Transcript_12243/g.26494  ORF Transcript_12243/g.26494 Transcript_12243/m.26494 type:complete len:93 (+) Transcript_12243:112-390(+)